MIRTGAINWSNPVAKCGLNDGLVSWWLGRGPRIGGGTWFDLCGKNHGTLTNMDPTTSWVGCTWPGANLRGLDFANVSDDIVGCGNIGAALPMTVILICKSGVGNPLFCEYRSGTNNGWAVSASAVGTTGGVYLTFGGVAAYSLGRFIYSGTWSFVAVTCSGNGGTANAYVADMTYQAFSGGTPVTVGTMSGTPNVFAIGNSFVFTNFYAASSVADCRVYNRVLSEIEIRMLYADSLAGYPQTLNRLSRRFAYQAAAPPAGTIPVFVHHYRMQGAA